MINSNLYNKETKSSINPEEVIKAPEGKRVLGFFDGNYWIVDEDDCRGCLMQLRKDEMSEYMTPIYEDEDIWVTQDAEFAIPGFYVVGPKKHLAGLADFSPDLSMKLGLITHLVRKGMRDELGIEFAETYHEERMKNSHYHNWILPCWGYAMECSGCMPKIFPSKVSKYKCLSADIISYLRCFNFEEEKEKILKLNDLMRKYFMKEEVINSIQQLHEKVKTNIA